MRLYGRTNFKNIFAFNKKYFTVRNAYVDTTNTTNQFYKPKNEMNYEVYETSFKEYFVPSQAITTIDNNGLSIFKFEPAVPDDTGFVKLPQVP
jgi:Holliday junction resolvase RusA-like endonuclease